MTDDREQLYYRVGRRYYPAHTTTRALFPAAGVWLVEYGPGRERARRITEIGEVPDPMRVASLERFREAICREMLRVWPAACVDDLATAAIRAIERASRKEAR